MGNSLSSGEATLTRTSRKATAHWNTARTSRSQPSHGNNNNNSSSHSEHSRVLFLLYLIHRTWNVVVDQKGKRSRSGDESDDSGAPRSHFGDTFGSELTYTDMDSSLYGSQYSCCTCSYCCCDCQSESNAYDAICRRSSLCDSEISYYLYEMAPSAGKSPPGTHHGLPNADTLSNGWSQNGNVKENQRPPVHNTEDYVILLKKFGKRTSTNGVFKSIYDNSEETDGRDKLSDKCNTLPAKKGDKKSVISTPSESETEMSLRQFGSITDLLTKLRSDLRSSYPSFVQEFVTNPSDGVALLLEALRAIQLSQTLPIQNGQATLPPAAHQRNNQSYQRRALLDELACLQCLSVCCARCPEAGSRLGTASTGLLPLAASATGTGIRSRIISLQLMTTACDRSAIGDHPKNVALGHTAVSEALSTLRLRCAEPVRFRLLVGMLNSNGGTGELQAIGLKFINTFVDSADTIQTKVYLQAELYQAGFDPPNMTKGIASSSPWVEKVRFEVKRWECIKIDVEELQSMARQSEQARGKMVTLERRVQILQEEKTVLSSMERRLQERCAELQRQIMRLQGSPSQSEQQSGNHPPEKRTPVALPRQVPPQSKRNDEDEGISSSENADSVSPEPPRIIPATNPASSTNTSHKFSIILKSEDRKSEAATKVIDDDEYTNTTIEDVIEELQNIVSDAEREIKNNNVNKAMSVEDKLEAVYNSETNEHEIIPKNLHPQPPRKSRSLMHLLATQSDDGSDYGLLLIKQETKNTFFDDDELDKNLVNRHKIYIDESYGSDEGNPDHPDVVHSTNHMNKLNSAGGQEHDETTNREILNAIMDAREKDNPGHKMIRAQSLERNLGPPQQFNGVFFMTDMNPQKKYPKPDITAALEAKRVTRAFDRMGSYGMDGMIDVVVPPNQSKPQLYSRTRATSMNIPQKVIGMSNENLNFQLKSGFSGGSGLVYSGQPPCTMMIRDNRTLSYTNGSKVTDLASGLY